MMDVEEEVEMLCIPQQPDMEQTVVVDVERNDHPLLLGLNVCHVFHRQCECLRIINGL